jgi:uncharacterized protein
MGTFEKYGPWALVTGASDGIGMAFARELAKEGYNLVLVARRKARLDALAEDLIRAHGIETHVLPLDMADRATTAALLEKTAEIDIGLIVTAAGFGSAGLFANLPVENEAAMVDVNCRAVVEQVHGMLPRLMKRGRGGIVLFSSLVAFQGAPRSATYAATKAFIQTFAEGLKGELAGSGVDVIAVAPGPVRTGFGDRANMQMGMAASPDGIPNEVLKALGRRGTVRPGFLSKFLGYNLTLLPRWGRVWVMTLIMRDMTKHQEKIHAA